MLRISLINKIVSVIKEETEDEDFDSFAVNSKAEQLLSVFDKKNSVKSINNKEEYLKFIPEFKNLFNCINNLNFEKNNFLNNEEEYEKRVQYAKDNSNKINNTVQHFKENFIKNSLKESKHKLKIN